MRNWFGNIRWKLGTWWHGRSMTQGFSDTDQTLTWANSGGFKRKLKDFGTRTRKALGKFFIWIIATFILAAIGVIATYLGGKLLP